MPADYDFGLSAKEEERAARLHSESIVIDLLFQGPCGSEDFPAELTEAALERFRQTSDPLGSVVFAMNQTPRAAVAGQLPAFREAWNASGVTAGNRQVELATLAWFSELFGVAQTQFDGLDWLHKATSAEHIRQAKARGEHAGFMSTQLTYGPFPDLSVLRSGYELGLRIVQLTYNSLSSVGAGCTERTDAGLSRFGADAVSLMNELGVIVDTGHCGRQTTLDACELSAEPVIASHTMAQGLHAHARGKSDEELQAIAATGGVIGIVAVPHFLRSAPGASIEDMLDHIDYITTLVGAEHVAIGTDWPMSVPDALMEQAFPAAVSSIGFRPEDRADSLDNLVGFASYRDFPNITRGLVARRYSDDDIVGILGGNALRVFERVCG
mgnify:CR=1 FL=1